MVANGVTRVTGKNEGRNWLTWHLHTHQFVLLRHVTQNKPGTRTLGVQYLLVYTPRLSKFPGFLATTPEQRITDTPNLPVSRNNAESGKVLGGSGVALDRHRRFPASSQPHGTHEGMMEELDFQGAL